MEQKSGCTTLITWIGIVVPICGGVVSIFADWDAGWNRLERTLPLVINFIEPVVSFVETSVTLPLWAFLLILWLMLLLPNLLSKLTRSVDLEGDTQQLPKPPVEFREVWIDWYVYSDGRIKWKPLRCAKQNCFKRITDVEEISEGKFLVCEDGHRVGNKEGFEIWKQRADEEAAKYRLRKEEQEAKLRAEHEQFQNDVASGLKTEEEFETWKRNQPASDSLAGYIYSSIGLSDMRDQLYQDFVEEHQRLAFERKINSKQ